MFYGISSVRLDFAQVVRIKTAAFFGIPGTMTVSQVVSVHFILFLNVFEAIPEWSL